ncbi:polysaccharide biosynthesis/export family protein [Alistipes communis]|uniref:polysaccharide biosynthesis/export family protein n=1 Tax=Alistipes communis TaxID=2585118 RepID=UPI003AF7D80B
MKHLGIFILGALLLASCATNKRAAYIQQVQTDIPTAIEQDYQIRIKPLDRLTVTINSKDPELAAPFNAASSYNSLNGLSSYSSSSNGNLQILTVDKKGKIQLPIIGEIDCDGLTRNELAKKIENTIRENGMVHDPIVIIQFADVKFSVLGEVARPGQFSITKDRISLFDALAMAGDLTIYGQRENVALIREENGMRTVHYFDLKNPDILTSPYFYLQQDDVVYVTPNKYKAQAGEINQNRSFYISLVSVAVSVATLLVTITR